MTDSLESRLAKLEDDVKFLQYAVRAIVAAKSSKPENADIAMYEMAKMIEDRKTKGGKSS